MNIIQQITQDARQHHNIPLPDGTLVSMILRFVPLQYGWWLENLTYNSFMLNNLRVFNSPNFLHQYRNQLPFGMACFSTASREPSQQQDFSSGNSTLYLLSSTEVQQFTEYLNGTLPASDF